jgi:hypothetical protein
MKTYSHLYNIIAEFFLEWEVFKTKICRENQITYYVKFFFRKSCCLWNDVKHIAGKNMSQIITQHNNMVVKGRSMQAE